jgi:hypothetical protein
VNADQVTIQLLEVSRQTQVLQLALTELKNMEALLKDSCEHLSESGKTALVSGVDSLYEYCYGCGRTF